jgi:hypothetical protein
MSLIHVSYLISDHVELVPNSGPTLISTLRDQSIFISWDVQVGKCSKRVFSLESTESRPQPFSDKTTSRVRSTRFLEAGTHSKHHEIHSTLFTACVGYGDTVPVLCVSSARRCNNDDYLVINLERQFLRDLSGTDGHFFGERRRSKRLNVV